MKLNKRFLFCLGIVILITSILPTGTNVFAQDEAKGSAEFYKPYVLSASPGQMAVREFAAKSTLGDELPGGSVPTIIEDEHLAFFPAVLNGMIAVAHPDIQISSVLFPEDNRTRHHTTDWRQYYVFRRAQWVSLQIGFSSDFQIATDSLLWSVLEPDQINYQAIPEWEASLPATSWAIREIETTGSNRTVEIFIPAGAALGEHLFGISLFRQTAEGNQLQHIQYSPAFYVIFNPFNDDIDPRIDSDVYNNNFSTSELNHYVLSGADYNYYGREYVKVGEKYIWVIGGRVDWVLNMFDPVIFLPVIAEVQGARSAKDAVRLLAAKDRWNHKDSDIIPKDSDIIEGNWDPKLKHNWRDAVKMMSFWNWGAAHPTGQCMDFGGLLAAMVRAIGVPVRSVTCVRCHGYSFHVWNEVWLNEVNPSAWSAVDGMEDVGPVRRNDSYFKEQLSGGLAVYTYDARTGKRIDVKRQY